METSEHREQKDRLSARERQLTADLSALRLQCDNNERQYRAEQVEMSFCGLNDVNSLGDVNEGVAYSLRAVATRARRSQFSARGLCYSSANNSNITHPQAAEAALKSSHNTVVDQLKEAQFELQCKLDTIVAERDSLRTQLNEARSVSRETSGGKARTHKSAQQERPSGASMPLGGKI